MVLVYFIAPGMEKIKVFFYQGNFACMHAPMRACKFLFFHLEMMAVHFWFCRYPYLWNWTILAWDMMKKVGRVNFPPSVNRVAFLNPVNRGLIHSWSKFWLSILIFKVQRTSMSFKSSFRALEDAEWSWLGFVIFVLVWIWSLVFHAPMFQILALILILKVQRTSISFKSWFGALEDTGGSWLGFGILILILIRSLVFGTPIFRILALYLDFEGAKNIHVL